MPRTTFSVHVELSGHADPLPLRSGTRSGPRPYPHPGAPDLNLPPKFACALLIRSCVIWALVRSSLVVLTALGRIASGRGLAAPGEVIAHPTPRSLVYHAAAVAALLLVDLRVSNERILLANLGFGRRVAVLPAIAVVAVLETALAPVLPP